MIGTKRLFFDRYARQWRRDRRGATRGSVLLPA
jgi:hypothetical protein